MVQLQHYGISVSTTIWAFHLCQTHSWVHFNYLVSFHKNSVIMIRLKWSNKAAQFVFNNYHRYSSATNMLNHLKWKLPWNKIYYYHALQDLLQLIFLIISTEAFQEQEAVIWNLWPYVQKINAINSYPKLSVNPLMWPDVCYSHVTPSVPITLTEHYCNAASPFPERRECDSIGVCPRMTIPTCRFYLMWMEAWVHGIRRNILVNIVILEYRYQVIFHGVIL